MKKIILCLLFVLIFVSNAWGDATSDLLKAVKDETTTPEHISALIKAGADVNAKNLFGFGWTVLMEAAHHTRNPEVIKVLLEAGAEINVKDSNENTALAWAVENDKENTEIVETLLQGGAYVNDKILLNALFYNNKKVGVIKALLQAGCDANAKDSGGSTALMLAVKSGNTNVVKLLLSKGADVNAKGDYGTTALMCAVMQTSEKALEIIKILLQAGANINAKNDDGTTALMYTAKYNKNPKITEILLRAGASINAEDDEGRTALVLSVKYDNNPEVVKILLNYGAKINASVKSYSKKSNNPQIQKIANYFDLLSDYNTALIKAVQNGADHDTINALIYFGAKVNGRDENGQTALMHEVRFGKRTKVIRDLIQAGASIDLKEKILLGKSVKDYADEKMMRTIEIIKNLDNDTDLLKALENNASPDIIRVIVEIGEDMNIKEAKALMIAAENTSYPEVIKILLNAGIDVNVKSKDGQTALMKAARFNTNPEIIRTLINAGADVKAKDSFFFGKNAKDWAIKSNASQEIIKILEGL